MEREILFTGIGGQSVQLSAHVLARAAAREGREVQLLGTYGGTMRGGPTESSLVVGDGPIETPPVVSRAWSALVMHHAYFPGIAAKLRPGGAIVLNATLFEGDVDRSAHQVFDVPATEIATDLGSPLAAAFVLVAAHAHVTGLVGIESLVEAMRESVPPYRQQHVETNEKALRAGFGFGEANAAPAWDTEAAA